MLFFSIDENEKHHTRTIYSLLDFLGDIGGLSDALSKIGSIIFGIAQLFTGSGLSHYLLNNILGPPKNRIRKKRCIIDNLKSVFIFCIFTYDD